MKNKLFTKLFSDYIVVVTEDSEYLLTEVQRILEAEGTELDTDIDDSMTVRFLVYNEDTNTVEEDWDLPAEYYDPSFDYGVDFSNLSLKQLVLYGYISKAESQDDEFVRKFIEPSYRLFFLEDMVDVIYTI